MFFPGDAICFVCREYNWSSLWLKATVDSALALSYLKLISKLYTAGALHLAMLSRILATVGLTKQGFVFPRWEVCLSTPSSSVCGFCFVLWSSSYNSGNLCGVIFISQAQSGYSSKAFDGSLEVQGIARKLVCQQCPNQCCVVGKGRCKG